MSAFWWAGISAAIAAVMVLVLWSVRRHQRPLLNLRSDSSIEELIPSLAGLTLGHCAQGNSVLVLENGSFYDVLLDRIANARHSVHFETFLWKEGKLGSRLADALCKRAQAGIAV